RTDPLASCETESARLGGRGTVRPTRPRRAGSRQRERCEYHPGEEPELTSMHLLPPFVYGDAAAPPYVSSHPLLRGGPHSDRTRDAPHDAFVSEPRLDSGHMSEYGRVRPWERPRPRRPPGSSSCSSPVGPRSSPRAGG